MPRRRSSLADKPVDGNQPLGDRIDGEEQTFESYGAEQYRAVGRNEAWGRNFNTIQRQTCFGHRPDISLAASDYDPLGTGGFQPKSFCERAW
jgi:hypothetical protein